MIFETWRWFEKNCGFDKKKRISSSVHITSISFWRGVYVVFREGRKGWCRLLPHGNTWAGPLVTPAHIDSPVLIKCMETSTHFASIVAKLHALYYPPLNYSRLTAKIPPPLGALVVFRQVPFVTELLVSVFFSTTCIIFNNLFKNWKKVVILKEHLNSNRKQHLLIKK